MITYQYPSCSLCHVNVDISAGYDYSHHDLITNPSQPLPLQFTTSVATCASLQSMAQGRCFSEVDCTYLQSEFKSVCCENGNDSGIDNDDEVHDDKRRPLRLRSRLRGLEDGEENIFQCDEENRYDPFTFTFVNGLVDRGSASESESAEIQEQDDIFSDDDADDVLDDDAMDDAEFNVYYEYDYTYAQSDANGVTIDPDVVFFLALIILVVGITFIRQERQDRRRVNTSTLISTSRQMWSNSQRNGQDYNHDHEQEGIITVELTALECTTVCIHDGDNEDGTGDGAGTEAEAENYLDEEQEEQGSQGRVPMVYATPIGRGAGIRIESMGGRRSSGEYVPVAVAIPID
uniref:Uncharacterized protein n=1 Tax=Chaetoceros debilis TaxID=122233 RepID=A0A7S3PVE3_9STRA